MKTNVVSVNFGAGREYPYLNDKFDLAVGDKVYVDGKLAGTPGTVTEVLTKFKVSLKYYKYVLQKIDYTVRGKFCTMDHYYIAAQNDALPFEQLAAWVTAPEPVDEDEEEEQFLYGDGYDIALDELEEPEEGAVPETEPAAFWHGKDYEENGRLKFVTVIGGKGKAVLQTEKNVTTVEFDLDAENRHMSNVYCDCIRPRLCADMTAVAYALRRVFDRGAAAAGDDFTLIERRLFRRVIENSEHMVIF